MLLRNMLYVYVYMCAYFFELADYNPVQIERRPLVLTQKSKNMDGLSKVKAFLDRISQNLKPQYRKSPRKNCHDIRPQGCLKKNLLKHIEYRKCYLGNLKIADYNPVQIDFHQSIHRS